MSVVPTWGAVELHARERIEAARDRLETAPPEAIPALQAEIHILRGILALPTILSPDSQIEPARAGY